MKFILESLRAYRCLAYVVPPPVCASLLSPPRVWRRSARGEALGRRSPRVCGFARRPRGCGVAQHVARPWGDGPPVWLCSSAHGASWHPAGVRLRGPLSRADTFCTCLMSLGKRPKAKSAPTSALGCVRARRPKKYDPGSWRIRPSMNRSGPAGQAVGG